MAYTYTEYHGLSIKRTRVDHKNEIPAILGQGALSFPKRFSQNVLRIPLSQLPTMMFYALQIPQDVEQCAFAKAVTVSLFSNTY